MRIGYGEDTHRLVEGRRLVLGGVEVPFEKGLLGHSDADVLTHAVIDAILGAMAAGDIGRLFPDTDDAYLGISSLHLLAQVVQRMREGNMALSNLDAVIVAQKPKLAPYIERMRCNIAKALGADIAAVSVKATTTEGCGPEGRGEAMSARCVCLLESR
ncbi:MAG: 2-C-methyl-D-erythritol 2,4-cyclodiphosphate synthase [Clostridia bacterium]|nr:2-C-methyl-D-erythritol 2,4-cyclodiphosphate synthase [Clostridia bacterium]